ncbi:hypothetical protein K402DRAFT_391820 [Aulographum hederae CBS 113979]|uniref:Ubiquitin-domain-containing protein n=1 Tax=Aulographum hederae CBS 113979 TaxID=1176131 RepID=A0A6G1H6H4_9PEZI|nr:hypothetical protein K402DRAFT_391820 [Aulographum hederae CBS 113979]
MAEETSAGETQLTFNVKGASDAKYVLTLPSSTTIADVKTKLASPDHSSLPAERQRLIFSGRILKDHDTLEGAKVKDGHTIHLVKMADSNARQNSANSGSSSVGGGGSGSAASPTPQLPNMATGTGNNPLAALTGARHAGFHGLPSADTFGPDGGMGANNPDEMLRQLENPMFLSQMNEAMQNPDVQRMILDSPMMRQNPQMRAFIQDPNFRQMMFNPEVIRATLNMQRSMGGMGGGNSAFPAPGVTDTTPEGQTPGQNPTNQQTPANPFGNMPNLFGGGAGAGAGAANPFAALLGGQQPNFANAFGTPAAGSTPTSPPPTTAQGTTPQGSEPRSPSAGQDGQTQPNPFANMFGGLGGQGAQGNPFAEMANEMQRNPERMRQMMEMLGGAGGAGGGMGTSPFGGLGGAGAGAGAGSGAPNPNAMADLLAALGGGAGGAGGFGGAPPQPEDTRPPEERYAEQLRQLNEMGFYEFERNVQALRRSGGNVQGAVEFLIGGS